MLKTMGETLMNNICDTLYNDRGENREPKREILTIVEDFYKKTLNEAEVKGEFVSSINSVIQPNMQVFFNDQYISLYMMKDILNEERSISGGTSRGDMFKKMLQIATRDGLEHYVPKEGDDIQSMKFKSIMNQLSIMVSEKKTNMHGGFVDKVLGGLSQASNLYSTFQENKQKGQSMYNPSKSATIGLIDNPNTDITSQVSQLGNTNKLAEERNISNILPSMGSFFNRKKSTYEEPSVQTTEKPSVQTTEKPSVQTTEKPSVQTTEKPSVQTTEKPSVQTTEKPSVQTTEKPSVQTSAETSVTNVLAGKNIISTGMQTIIGPILEPIAKDLVKSIDSNFAKQDYVPEKISQDIYTLVKDALKYHLEKPEGRQMFLRQIEPILKRYVFKYTSSSSDLLTLSILRHLCTSNNIIKNILENAIQTHISSYDSGNPYIFVTTVYNTIKNKIDEQLNMVNPIASMYTEMKTLFSEQQIGDKIVNDYKQTICSSSAEIKSIISGSDNQQQNIMNEENAKLTNKNGGKLKRVSKTKRRRRTFRKRNTTQRYL